MKDLDGIERGALREDPAEDLAYLVFLAARPEEARSRRDLEPAARRRGRERLEPASRDLLQDRALDGRRIRLVHEEVQRGESACGLVGLRRRREGPAQHGRRVDEAARGEVRVVAAEDALELRELSRIVESPGGKRRGREAGRPDLFEGALQGAVEARAVAQLAEVGVRLQVLGACLLDEGQRLRAGEKAQPFAGEPGSGDSEGDRAHRLDPEVDPGVALAGQTLDERVANGECRRDEHLLLERPRAADGGKRSEQIGNSLAPCRRLGLGFFERQKGLRVVLSHRLGHFYLIRGQTRSARTRVGVGLHCELETGEPTPLRRLTSHGGRLRVRRRFWTAGDPANLMRVMPP